jgi:hypothetical protein
LFFAVGGYLAFGAISIPIAPAGSTTQNFDSMGTTATATLPADFRVDKPTTVRTVGTFAAAGTVTGFVGGANLSSSATNGIYNFGSGTTTTGPDRAVGFLSSSGGTVSGNLYAQLANSTGGDLSGLQISYNVEKYRGGSNPAGFRIQLFYSTDGSTWTSAGNNFLTSFGADASNAGFATAPGATVPVSNTLTAAIPSGSNFYLAWNYSVTSGTTTTNAQALAIDDISILGVAGSVSTNPTGTGTASPSSVVAGASTLLTVNVTPGANPTSTGVTVTADLSAIGGSAAQPLTDGGNNAFTFTASVPANITGAKSLPVTIHDAQGRTGSASISLTVTSPSTNPSGSGSANPVSLLPGATTLLTVNVTPGINPASTGIAVTADLTAIGGTATQAFADNGNNSFSFQATVSTSTAAGLKSLPIKITDDQARAGNTTIALTVQSPPPPTTVKISQVYGGGGNSGSTFKNDFIEIFNQSATTLDVSNWSVQYSSATASTWSVTNMCAQNSTCTILPGHYYLVQESAGAGGFAPLPTPDATGTLTLSGTAAKIALVQTRAALSGCPNGGDLVDLVGFGGANCSETTPTPTLDNTTAAVRKGNGCVDTGNNNADFVGIGPIPRNSAAPANFCASDTTQISGVGVASPGYFEASGVTVLSVRVAPATTSTGIAVTGNLTSIGGLASQIFYDDGTHGDATAGDNVFSFQIQTDPQLSQGAKNIPVTVTDAQGRSEPAPITLTIAAPTCGVERWSVKTGTDADAGKIDLVNTNSTSIVYLRSLPAPADPPGPPDNARLQPTETTIFSVNGILTVYKKETDVDYHIVVRDGAGNTIITEIPYPGCVLAPSPLTAAIANARAEFDAHLTAIGTFQTVNIPVQVKGVGFFDFEHGQTGVAPNAIELHPVTDIKFTGVTSTTLTSGSNPAMYAQPVAFTAKVNRQGGVTPTGNVNLLDGANNIASGTLDPTGQVVFNLSNLTVGLHSLTAWYDGDSTSGISVSDMLTQTVIPANQTISFAPLGGKTYGDADFTVSATATSGLPVSFSVVSGPATIAGNLVHLTGAGAVIVRASQPGNSNYNAAQPVDQSFTVLRTATGAILLVSKAVVAAGTPVTLTAGVTSTAGIPTGTVTFFDGAAALASVPLNGTGQAVLTTSSLALGPHSLSASYSGDTNFNGSAAAPMSELIFAYATGGGSFVIGDGNAAIGTQVTFWSSQWEKVNGLSGSAAPSEFEGFAGASTPNPPAAGGVWSSRPGNSQAPPDVVPAYLAVIVTSSADRSGATLTGNVATIVVVRTDAGYGPDPGHDGTGTVVAVVGH